MAFLSSFFYLIGCLILIPAGFYLNYPNEAKFCIIQFIVACSFLTLAAIVDMFPALGLNKTTTPKSDEEKGTSDEELLSEQKTKYRKWLKNLTIAIFYLLGGIFFLTGSILYYPTVALFTQGTWVFRTGSICYTIGSLLSLHSIWAPFFEENSESKVNTTTIMFTTCLVLYIIGSSLYITGGILSQLNNGKGTNECWIAGGFFFSGGALSAFLETIRKK